jgi:hypothetical protein
MKEKKVLFGILVVVFQLLLAFSSYADNRGITNVLMTTTGNGTNLSFTNPYTNTTENCFAGVIYGTVDGASSGFYCVDIRNWLVWSPQIYNDSSYTRNKINYILLNHVPYKTLPYTGGNSDINIEAAAVQCALWHYSDSVNMNTVSNATVKQRANEIIADADLNAGLLFPVKNVQILPVSVVPNPSTPAVLRVRVLDELGKGITGKTVNLTTTSGILSTTTLVTGDSGYTPTFTLTKGSSWTAEITAVANTILSPGTIFIGRTSPDVIQKITLAQAKTGNKIDYFDITWDSTSGGGGGGLESSYDLGELLLQRYLKIRDGQTTKMLAKTSYLFSPTYVLKNIVPSDGPYSSAAVETTPFDILGISNATSAYAVDYKVNSSRVGAVFSTTTNPPSVYSHTKAVCDRYSKYELQDLRGTLVDNRDFYMAKLYNSRLNYIDYSITFSVYETVNGFIVDNKWTIEEYQVPQNTTNVYNFQVWGGTEFATKQTVSNILNKLNGYKPVTYIQTLLKSADIYIRKASYENDGKIRFTFQNTTTQTKTLPFTISYTPQQGMPVQSQTVNIAIAPEVSSVVLPFGYLSGANITMTCDNGFMDAVFIGGGLYAPFAGPNSIISGYENIVSTTPQFPEGSKVFTGGARIYGYTNDVLYIARSLDATYQGTNISGYDKLKFEAKGTGVMTVQLEALVDNKNVYPYVTVNLSGNFTSYEIPMENFRINGQQVDLSAVSLVMFKQEVWLNPSMTYADFSIRNAGMTPECIGISSIEGLVKDYSLSQNYPNPFNPTTSIDINVPKEGLVTLKVYDILGKEVAVLINGVMKPVSNYKVIFDAGKLPTGVYMYKLTAPNGISLMKKMMLIK